MSGWVSALESQESATRVVHRSDKLPPDVMAFGIVLVETHDAVEESRRRADGMFFDLVGLDALIGIIPVVGGVYSAGEGLNLLRHAIRAKCGSGTITFGAVLILIDIIVGFFPGIGDIADLLFRSHAFFANRILDVTRGKMLAIQAAREEANAGTLSEHDLTILRDTLFRGGKTEKAASIRTFIILGVVGFLLYSCVQEYRDRQAAIRSCQARGEWFCSWRL